jgi:hypothetical protein
MSKEKPQMQNERSTTSWREEPNVESGMTWMPDTAHGPLSEDELAMLPTSVFAYPKHRQLALTDAEHVEWAIDQFWQVKEASDADREQAFLNLQEAAQHYSVQLPVDDWRMLPRLSRQLPPKVQEDSDDTSIKDLEEANSSTATNSATD